MTTARVYCRPWSDGTTRVTGTSSRRQTLPMRLPRASSGGYENDLLRKADPVDLIPVTAGLRADKARKLHRAGLSKAEIAGRLQIGRTSVRRILA